MGRCMQLCANSTALRTPVQCFAGCGAFQRRSPTGGAANGTPRKTRMPAFVVVPSMTPFAVLTWSAAPCAGATAVNVAIVQMAIPILCSDITRLLRSLKHDHGSRIARPAPNSVSPPRRGAVPTGDTSVRLVTKCGPRGGRPRGTAASRPAIRSSPSWRPWCRTPVGAFITSSQELQRPFTTPQHCGATIPSINYSSRAPERDTVSVRR